jgi:electron transport complex protein RnfD
MDKFTLSSSPHVGPPIDETHMTDVLIALVPAAACGVYFFGLNALLVIVLSMAGP